jgi:phage terminase small subunit
MAIDRLSMLPKNRPKMRKFVQAYVKTGNATQAVREAGYNVKNDLTAGSIASENLQKPVIQEAIAIERGFNEATAKDVVREIMLDSEVDPNARLRATDQVFKVVGSYAPEKSLTLNVDIIDDQSFMQLMSKFQGASLPDNERKAIGE